MNNSNRILFLVLLLGLLYALYQYQKVLFGSDNASCPIAGSGSELGSGSGPSITNTNGPNQYKKTSINESPISIDNISQVSINSLDNLDNLDNLGNMGDMNGPASETMSIPDVNTYRSVSEQSYGSLFD
jgi:hypothetical protein